MKNNMELKSDIDYEKIWELSLFAATRLGCENQFKENYTKQNTREHHPERIYIDTIRALEDAWAIAMEDKSSAHQVSPDIDHHLEKLKYEFYLLSLKPSDQNFQPFYQLFEEKAHENPEHPAIIYQHNTLWTYQRLNETANQLARVLLEVTEGTGRETRVALFFMNLPQAIVSILAVMKAGLSYVPLTIDKKLSNERLAFYIKQSKAQFLLVQDELINHDFVHHIKNQMNSLEIACYSDCLEKANSKSSENLHEVIKPEDEVYTIFTSGSKGIPKGVRIAHRGLSKAVQYVQSIFNITKTDRITWFSLLTFDASLLDIMTALGTGATSVIVPQEIRASSKELTDYLAQHEVTIVSLVATVLEMLDPRQLPKLRGYISMGERGKERTLKDFRTLGRENNLPRISTEGYGPTEATICFLIAIVINHIHLGNKCVPGSRAQLLTLPNENELHPKFPMNVNEGEEGELYITGDALALGYIDETSEDQKRFRCITNPDDPYKYIPIYQTGDVFQQNEGNFEFVRRVDDSQYKINGEVIHPYAIEAALAEYKINEHYVFSRTHVDIVNYGIIDKQPYIRAFIEINKSVLEEEMTEQLISQLIFYLRHHPYCTFIPSRFNLVSEWPTTANGKLDKDELIQNVTKTFYAAHPFRRMPQTEIEQTIQLIWQDVLDIPRQEFPIGKDDNFYDLGGDSKRKYTMLTLISQQCKVSINELRFDAHPTIGALADQIDFSAQHGCLIQWISDKQAFHDQAQKKHFPLIFINSLTGDATREYRHIIDYFQENKADWPLLCTKAVSLDRPDYAVPSIPRLALDYIKSLTEDDVLKNYKEPLIIIGYSAAGTLAREIVHQLQTKGREVAVCCIDTLSVNYYIKLSPAQYAAEIINMMCHMSGVLGLTEQQVKNVISLETLQQYAKSEQLNVFWQLLMRELTEKSTTEKHKYLGIFATIYNLVQHQFHYDYKPADYATLIAFSDTTTKVSSDENLGWDPRLFSDIKRLTGKHGFVVDDPAWVNKTLMPALNYFCENAESHLLLSSLIKRQRSLYLERVNNFLNEFPDVIRLLYIHKNLNDINKSGKTHSLFDVNELLDSTKLPKKILVTGRIGGGKTPFCQRFVNQWLTKNQEKNYVKLVLWFSLGELEQNSIPEELSAITPYLNKLAKDILFIFDGYDKLDRQSPLTAHIKKILTHKNVSALLTSTSTVTDLRKLAHFDQWIELALNRETIKETITEFFKNDQKLSQGLIACLKDKELQASLHTPFQVSLLCRYWKETADSTQGTLDAFNFVKFTVEKFWERFRERSRNKSKFHSPLNDNIYSIQERAQNILESLAHHIWPEDIFLTEALDSEIRKWYSTKFGSDLGDELLSPLRSEILNCGLVVGEEFNIRDLPQKIRFSSSMMVEYLTVQYLAKHMNQGNFPQYARFHALTQKYTVLYDPNRPSDENEYLRLLLETTPIKSFSEKDKEGLKLCIKSGFKNNHIEESSLYQYIFSRVKESGVNKIEEEFKNFDPERFENFDFETLLIRILEFKTDDSVLNYIDKDKSFIVEKTLYLSDPNSRFTTKAEILEVNKVSLQRLEFKLDNGASLSLIIGLNRTIYKVTITNKVEYYLTNYLINHSLKNDLSETYTVDINPDDVNILGKTIKAGQYLLSLRQSRHESKSDWKIVNLGKEAGELVGLATKKYKRSFILQSLSSNESHQIDIEDHNKKYAFGKSDSKDFIITVSSNINGHIEKPYTIDLRTLESCKINVYLVEDVTGITPDNAKDKIKIVEIVNESKERLKKQKEIAALKSQVFQTLSAEQNQTFLYNILLDIIKNKLVSISDQVMSEINETVIETFHLKDILTRIVTLSDEIGIKTSIHAILITIALNVNYSQIAPKEKGMDVMKVMKLLNKAFKHIHSMKNKDLVLVVGKTGAGKSTFLIYLQGILLKAIENQYGQMIIDLKNKESFNPQLSPTIGHSLGRSQTKYVQAYKIINSSKALSDLVESTHLCDTPGGDDSRGLSYDLATVVSIDQTIECAGSIKSMVLTIPYENFLLDRGNPVIEQIENFSQRFKEDMFTHKNIRNSIFIHISKHYAYGKAKDSIRSRIDELLTDDKRHIEKLQNKGDEENSQEIGTCEFRIKVWSMLQDMLHNNQAFFVEIQDRDKRVAILKMLANAPGIDKKLFTKAMRREKIQRHFSNDIQMALHTWQVQIMGGYLDKVNKISKHLSAINEHKNEIQKLKENTGSKMSLISERNAQIRQIELKISKLTELKNTSAARFSENDPVVIELKKACTQLIADRLKTQRETKRLLENDINTKKTELAHKITEINNAVVLKQDHTRKRNQFVTQKETLEKGGQKIPLSEVKYHLGQIVEFSNRSREQVYETYKNVAKPSSETSKSIPPITIGEYTGPLCYLLYIEKEYMVVPKDEALRKNFLMTRQGGTDYTAYLEGEGFEPDTSVGNGIPNASADGTKIIYPIRLNLNGNTQPLPWVSISHYMPNQEINKGPIRNLKADLDNLEISIASSTSTINRLTEEKQRLDDEIDAIRVNIANIEREIYKIEKRVIHSGIEPAIKECKKSINDYQRTIEDAKQQIQRNSESEQRKNDRIAEIQFELTTLQIIKKRIAIVIKTQLDIAKLLREFAQMGVADNLGIEKNFTQSQLISDCLSYISFYDQNVEQLIKAVEKDLTVFLEEENDDLKNENSKNDFKQAEGTHNKKDDVVTHKQSPQISLAVTSVLEESGSSNTDRQRYSLLSQGSKNVANFFKDDSSRKKQTSQEFANENGFEIRKTAGDGNCFFSSIAILLNHQNGTFLTHADIRAAAIKYLNTHVEQFKHIFGDGLEFGTYEQYIQRMVRDKVWALGPIIDATSLCYQIRLTIIDFRENEEHFIRYNEDAKDKPLLTLCRTGEDTKCQHYDAFIHDQIAEMESYDKPLNSQPNQ